MLAAHDRSRRLSASHWRYPVAFILVPFAAVVRRWSDQLETQAFCDYYPFLRYHNFTGSCYGSCDCSLDLRRPPGLVARFDWVVGHGHSNIPERRSVRDPRSVYAAPNALQQVLALAAASFDRNRSDRVLLVANLPNGVFLSEALGEKPQETLSLLGTFFHRVYHQVKDVNVSGVFQLLPALSDCQVSGIDARAAEASIRAAGLDFSTKTRGVLAAWGAIYPDMELAMDWAGHSRRSARRWAESTAGQAVGADVRVIDRREYMRELSRYRFMLSPLGREIVSSSLLQALLVLTVPIAQRGPFAAFDELLGVGYPIVVLDEWEEISPEKIFSWWQALAGRLAAFRQNCLTAEAYWQMTVGARERCM